MDNSKSGSGMWLGMAVGLLVGAASALLLAPMKGEETRTKIKDSYGTTVDKVKDLSQTAKQKVQEMRTRGTSEEEVAAGARRTTEQAVMDAQEIADSVTDGDLQP